MQTQNGQHVTLVGRYHIVENVNVENVTIFGDDLPQEQQAEKAQHPDTARSAIIDPASNKQHLNG